MKGYKVFNPDWTCRGFQYEVGKTYKHDGDISPCRAGFHFCRKAADCFQYYSFNPNNKVAEVEALGLVESDDTKSVTNEIHIVREIPWAELLELVNAGKGCTGMSNSGNRNSGNRNSGNRNSGNWNSGDSNSGYRNSGDSNSGNWNSGNWNSGDWNSGDSNSGYFSTITPKINLFEKPTELTKKDVDNIKGIQILNWNYENNWWIYSENMSEEEKKAHPEHETLGGYIKTVPFKEACELMWSNLTADEKAEVQKIPNFDADIFKRITGIEV